MARQGSISVDRSILDWVHWEDSPVLFKAWIWMLLVANWKDTQRNGITINRGSLMTSYRKIALAVGCSIETAKRIVKTLVNTGEISVYTTNNYTIITINNYNKYQQKNKKKESDGVLTISTLDSTPNGTGVLTNSTPNGTGVLTNSTPNGTGVLTISTQIERNLAHELASINNSNKVINNIEEEDNNNNHPLPQSDEKKDFVFDEKIKSKDVVFYFTKQSDLWREETQNALHIGKDDNLLNDLIISFKSELVATGVEEKTETDLRRHFLSYARKLLKSDDKIAQRAKKSVERMADASAYGISDKKYSNTWD